MKAVDILDMEPIDVVIQETVELADSCIACYVNLHSVPNSSACEVDYNRLWDVTQSMLETLYPNELDRVHGLVTENRAKFQDKWDFVQSNWEDAVIRGLLR